MTMDLQLFEYNFEAAYPAVMSCPFDRPRSNPGPGFSRVIVRGLRRVHGTRSESASRQIAGAVTA
jgi:hypothetical protein